MGVMKILGVGNHKGGVGKTASTRALGDVLAGMGLRVLMVDSDHQGSLSLSCGVLDADPCLANVYQVGGRDPLALAKVIVKIKPGLDLAPASLALAAAETEVVSRPGRDFILADALDTVKRSYDICLVDCPPALGQLVVNALCAVDSVLIPSPAQPVDLAGVRMFLRTVDRMRHPRLNPNLTIFGVLLTFFNGRLNTHKDSRAAMLAADWPVLPMTIPRSVRVAESAATGESIISFEPGNPAAKGYQALGEVVAEWLNVAR